MPRVFDTGGAPVSVFSNLTHTGLMTIEIPRGMDWREAMSFVGEEIRKSLCIKRLKRKVKLHQVLPFGRLVYMIEKTSEPTI